MTTEAQKNRAKARYFALAQLARRHRSEYQDYYQAHLKTLGGKPQKPQRAPEIKPDCAHPKDSWKVLPYGTWCGVCNARVR